MIMLINYNMYRKPISRICCQIFQTVLRNAQIVKRHSTFSKFRKMYQYNKPWGQLAIWNSIY